MRVLTCGVTTPSAEVLASSVMVPMRSATVISGVSLVPVMVTTTVEVSVEDSLTVSSPVLDSAMEKMRVCPTLTLLGSSPSFVSEPMARIFPLLDRDIDEALLC